MRTLAKYVIAPMMILSFLGVFAMPASAQLKDVDLKKQLDTAGSKAGFQTGTSTSLQERIGNFIQVALQFLGIIALVIIVYAGFLWMIAGDSDKVGKAKKLLLNGVIGLIIITSAYAIASFVISNI